MIELLKALGRINAISPRQRKKIIWKTLQMIGFKDIPFETDFFGFKYRGHTKNLIDRYVYFLGSYETGMLDYIKSRLNHLENKIFLDIGANVGHHTLFAAGHASHIYSFEPYEKVRLALEEKVAVNSLKNVTVVPYALGTTNEELLFFEPADFNTGTGSFIKEFKPTNQDNGLKLCVRQGTELLNELDIKSAGLIKLDVEGFEASVLLGLLPFIEKHRPEIIMEYSKESKKLFDENPDLKTFLRSLYDMKAFDNPNKTSYKLLPWNFDRFADVVLVAKK